MYNSIAEVPKSQYASFERDSKSPALIDRWKLIRNIIKVLIYLPGVLWVFVVYSDAGTRNAIFATVIAFFICKFISSIVDRRLLVPLMYKRYIARSLKMDEEMRAWGMPGAYIYRWCYPSPGVFGIDTEQNLILFNSEETDYIRNVLLIKNILTAKIEKEQDLHTQTYHSGRWNYWNNSGMSYTGAGQSNSVTVAVNRIYLEISYLVDGNPVPHWFVAPYYENRQEAETMLLMLQRAMA